MYEAKRDRSDKTPERSLRQSSELTRNPGAIPLDRSRSPSLLQLQRMYGNRHVQRLVCQMRQSPLISHAQIQSQLTIGAANDRYEQEADRVAAQVMQMPDSRRSQGIQRQPEEEINHKPLATAISPLIQQERPAAPSENSFTASAAIEQHLEHEQTKGSPLPDGVRSFMEPRFGSDLSQVRVHTDHTAIQMNRELGAHAFTHGQHIYYGAGKQPGRDELTAHEITHIFQQTGAVQSSRLVQRVVEVRPPGRGEASAFERRQELIDRLNRQSPAIRYSLADRVLQYEVLDEAALTNFDRQMQSFIDRGEVVPMRLINRSGLVDGQPLLIDSLQLAYVDLDDMLASDDLSFQLNLIHFLVERFGVRNYERRIGTDMSAAFPRAHQAGIDAETEHLRSVIGDPTIRFNHEREENGRTIFVYRSREGYQIVHVFGRNRGGVQGGQVFVRSRDNRRLTIEQLRAERAGTASGAAAPNSPRFQLTLPSLLQPPNPAAQYHLGNDFQLHLDPAIEAMIAAQQIRQRLSQPNLQATLAAISLPIPLPNATSGPNPFSLPMLPQAPPLTPQAGPSSPRPGTWGDVLSAVIGLPQVRPLVDQAQARATQAAESAWQGIPPTGQHIIVGAGIGLGVGGLTWVLADPNLRTSLSQLSTPLNDRVIPIPGLTGLGLEVNTGNGNLMLGLHLDLGQLLPPFLGFGAGSFNPIGAPPQPQPLTLPGP
jgi:Domain of unknown function (DUF4157)